MKKRGQMILIAALITVGAIFSMTAIINQARANEENKAFYDLSREVDFEGKRVLDYGVYKSDNTNSLIKSFISNYSNYIRQEKVLFIIGNSSGLNGTYFTEDKIGSVGIGAGGGAQDIPIQYLTGKEANVTRDGKNIKVNIDDIVYPFSLEPGENFFFIIIKDDKGDQLVSTK
jgi:hypothetical protein